MAGPDPDNEGADAPTERDISNNFTCSNCSLEIDGNSDIPRKVTAFALANKVSGGTLQISVLDALATVFNIKLDNTSSLQSNLEVCLPCGSYLAELYRNYQEFLQLSATNSEIYELIKLSLQAEVDLTKVKSRHIHLSIDTKTEPDVDGINPLQDVKHQIVEQVNSNHQVTTMTPDNQIARISERLRLKRARRSIAKLEQEEQYTSFVSNTKRSKLADTEPPASTPHTSNKLKQKESEALNSHQGQLKVDKTKKQSSKVYKKISNGLNTTTSLKKIKSPLVASANKIHSTRSTGEYAKQNGLAQYEGRSSNFTPRKKKSNIWNFFKVTLDGNRASCNMCGRKMSRGGIGKASSTTSLRNHLRFKHSKQFYELLCQDAGKKVQWFCWTNSNISSCNDKEPMIQYINLS